MKKVFLVYGHYNEKSFNAAIRDTFIKTANENGNEVDCVDLYKEKFNKKVVTYVIKFDKFYEAENYHQDYYRKKFLNYLRYKKACGREKKLNSIWNK